MTEHVESVGTLSQYIHEYGPFTVILAVFAFIFIMIIIYILYSNKKSIESDREMTAKLVTSILNKYFEENLEVIENVKHYDEKNIVNIFMELNKTLRNVCESIMEKTNSDRTAIYVFHNGTVASHGLPFFKLSCISETISKGSNLNMKMNEHIAMPLSIFDSIVTGLYNNSEYRITLNEKTGPCELLFIKNTKIKDCLFIPIYDDLNNMMGFVFNGYNVLDPNRDIEKDKEYLLDLAKMARPVIEFSKFQEYKSKEKE